MKKSILLAIIIVLMHFNSHAAVIIEINIGEEIDLKNGTYLAKEYGGQNRYALINHSHGRFESGDIAIAKCKEGFIVSKLPKKFEYIKKFLKSTDFVFINCTESD
jgi:hypothetical protein